MTVDTNDNGPVDNSMDERLKYDAFRTLKQCRADVTALLKRMETLEGDNPPANDSYALVLTNLEAVTKRMRHVCWIAQQMNFRAVTGIKPELN